MTNKRGRRSNPKKDANLSAISKDLTVSEENKNPPSTKDLGPSGSKGSPVENTPGKPTSVISGSKKETTSHRTATAPSSSGRRGRSNATSDPKGKSKTVQTPVDLFPAIKQPKNGMQVKYFIPHSLYYTQEKVDILNKYHPCTLETVHRYNCYNSHPLCAAFRAIGEAHMLSSLIGETAEEHPKELLLMDVGGSVKRHHALKRDYVFCCVPDKEAKDVLRKFNLPGREGLHYCHHDWQSCRCVNPDASMSVHSIYYLTPTEIGECILRQKYKVHYAMLHRYPLKRGVLMHGEMEYVRVGEDVEVMAKGNSTPYIHNNMDWLDTNSHEFVVDEVRYTLVWDLDRSFEDVHIYRFVVSTASVACKVSSALKIDFDLVEAMEEVAISNLKPEENIGPEGYTAYLRRVRTNGKRLGLPIPELVKLAATYYVKQDVTVEPPSTATWYTSLQRDKALRMLYPSNVKWYAGITASCLVAYAYGANPVVGLAALGLAAASATKIRTPVVTSGLERAVWAGCLSGGMLMASRSDGWKEKLLWVLATPVAFSIKWLGSACLSLPAVLFDYCSNSLPRLDLSKRKTLEYRLPDDWDSDCKPTPRATPYVYHPEHVPYMPRRCGHNYDVCIRNRVLCDTPAPTSKFELSDTLVRTASLINNTLEPLSFDSWVSRFPPKKQLKLRGEYEAVTQDYVDDFNINASNLFLKAEFYPEIKPPRPIHSSNVLLNFMTGRWLIPIAESLAENLPPNILFALHGDAAEIGRFYDKYSPDSLCKASDFSKFDSTEHEGILNEVARFCELCGMPPEVARLMRLDASYISVRSRKGFNYKCKGLRCSGRSETLLGNSLVTITMAEYATAGLYRAVMVKGDDIVFFLDPNTNLSDEEMVCRMTEHGLVAKLETVPRERLEFCSSYFIPFAQGTLLTPKPGKLLAKTFWCKQLHLNEDERELQFAGILKGLANNIAGLPGLRGLYHNPVYKRKFTQADAIQDEYGEYSPYRGIATIDTVLWMMNHYDLTIEDLDELEVELASSFPVRLKCPASGKMIECDWSEANYNADELLVEKPRSWFKGFWHAITPVVEESARHMFPITTTVILSLVEGLYNRSLFNPIGHLFLLLVNQSLGWLPAVVLHALINGIPAGPKLSLSSMVRKNRNSRNKQKKKPGNPNSGKPASGPKKGLRKQTASSLLKAYASVIGDPCQSNLLPGLHGTTEGILAKHKTSFVAASTVTNGFFLWCPVYTGNGTTGAGQYIACLGFTTTNSTTAPVNTAANPLGTGANSGFGLKVGSADFVSSSTVSDFRLLSACMRMTYTGTTSTCSGQLAYLENVPTQVLLSGNATIANLFSLAGKTERLGLDVNEVTYRPSEEITHFFRDENSGIFKIGAGTPTVFGDTLVNMSPSLFGFAWRGVPSNDQLSFEFIQSIEWRPEVTSGYVVPVPYQTGPSYVDRALKFLDDNVPNWSTTLMRGAHKAINMGIKAAFAPNLTIPRITYPGYS